MRFTPPCCPYDTCPSRSGKAPFQFQRRGAYVRRCDQRFVPKFSCETCRKRFSLQTFRLDYRLRKPWLNPRIAGLLCAKVTLRKIAEIEEVTRPTVERRLRRFGEHARALHRAILEDQARRGGLRCLTVQLDEFETFETDRRLRPVTVPVLIDPHSYFVIHVDTAPLPPRGNLRPRDRERRQAMEAKEGRRRSGSAAAVTRTLAAWKAFGGSRPGKMLQSDKKSSYRRILRKVFAGEDVQHAWVKSTAPRNYGNLLFPCNHTNALFRDSMSRLVRRTWAAAKKRVALERHLWLYAVFRNYVREITRKCRKVSSAMALGVMEKKLTWTQLLRWKAPFFLRLAAP